MKKRILVLDIGGTNVKVLLSGQKTPLKIPSGPRLTPSHMVAEVRKATAGWKYEAVTIGFPAAVVRGKILHEPKNLGRGWVRFDFQKAFRKPVVIINDAAMQALGSYDGGTMLFLGLGNAFVMWSEQHIPSGIAALIVATVPLWTTLLDGLRPGQTVVGFLDPIAAPEGVRALAEKGVTAFALDLIPRISRAQAMDALSSVATVMGYKAVLLAADTLPRVFPMMMTAAGTLSPARVFVIGGGVAGLQAIATARRLGAVVQAYDIRPAVKEQVESLGARFVELPLETGDAQDQGGYAKAMGEEFYKRQRGALKVVPSEHPDWWTDDCEGWGMESYRQGQGV